MKNDEMDFILVSVKIVDKVIVDEKNQRSDSHHVTLQTHDDGQSSISQPKYPASKSAKQRYQQRTWERTGDEKKIRRFHQKMH